MTNSAMVQPPNNYSNDVTTWKVTILGNPVHLIVN